MNTAAYIPKRDGKKQSLCSVFLVDEGLASRQHTEQNKQNFSHPRFPGIDPLSYFGSSVPHFPAAICLLAWLPVPSPSSTALTFSWNPLCSPDIFEGARLRQVTNNSLFLGSLAGAPGKTADAGPQGDIR